MAAIVAMDTAVVMVALLWLQLQLWLRLHHIKLNCHRSDILLTNAIYRLVTPRDLPHMTPGAPLGHGQVMLGVHRLFFLHTIEIHAFYLSCANARVGS